MSRNRLITVGALGACLLLTEVTAQADTVEDLMRQLKAKGVLSEQEYQSLSKSYAAQPATAKGKADTVDALMRTLQAKGVLNNQEYQALSQQHAAEPAPAPVAAAEPGPTEAAAASPFIRRMDKGVGIQIGPVDVMFSGSVNAFYVQDWPDSPGADTTVLGGIANVNGNDAAAVRNGLLPGDFNINISTRQEGLDVGATFGFYPGLNSVSNVGGANSAGNSSGLGTSGIDFRQQFITVGNESIGTFKGGRDIGMFGRDAILNDFTLLGVGSPGSNRAPSNTSFGRIGLGYVYTDFIPQLSYTSPTFGGGFTGAFGVFTPLDAVNFSSVSGTLSAHDQPGFQGNLSYKGSIGSVKTQIWTDFITQKLESAGGNDALSSGDSVRGYGFDLGGKFGFGPAEFVLYGYTGSGLGSTGLFFDAVSETGEARDSYGYYVQGTYKIDRFTLGISQGASYLDLASNEVNPLLVRRNESQAVALHYRLTDWVTLVAEYIHTYSKAQGGNHADENTFAAGGRLAF